MQPAFYNSTHVDLWFHKMNRFQSLIASIVLLIYIQKYTFRAVATHLENPYRSLYNVDYSEIIQIIHSIFATVV